MPGCQAIPDSQSRCQLLQSSGPAFLSYPHGYSGSPSRVGGVQVPALGLLPDFQVDRVLPPVSSKLGGGGQGLHAVGIQVWDPDYGHL